MKSIIAVVCLALVVSLVAPFISRADDASSSTNAPDTKAPDWQKMYEEQKKRTDDLERRLSVLEDKNTQDVYVVKEDLPESTMKFLKQTEIDGYVSSSYFYNFNRPGNHGKHGTGFRRASG